MSGLPDYTEATQIYGDVNVTGTVSISGSVTVTGTVSISGTVTVTGTVSVSGTVTVSGTVSISGTVTVSGTVSVSGTVTVSGTVSISGTVTVSGAVTVTGTVSISGTVTVTGAVTVTGTVSISGTVTVTGAVTVSGTVSVSGTVTVSGTVSISGTVTISGTVSISGTVTISGSVTITGTVTISGSVSITNATLDVDITNTVISTGQTGPAIGMDGTNSYASCASHADYTFTTEDFTLVMKIRARSYSGGPVLLCKGLYNSDGYYVQIDTNGQLKIVTNQSGAVQQTLTSAGAISVNTDYVLHFTRSGAACKIYINGSDATSVTGTHVNPTTNTKTLYIGCYNTLGFKLDGIVYYARIYSGVAFSSTQVTEDYNNPQSPLLSGMKLWLKFAEGTGTSSTDSSGNSHTCTLTSCLWMSAIGSVPAAIAVNIQASQVTMNVSITANSVELTVIAPSGKMVSAGGAVPASTTAAAGTVNTGQEGTAITVSGRGKLMYVSFFLDSQLATDKCNATNVRIYVDGSLKFNVAASDLLNYGGGSLNPGLCSAVSTWYQANSCSPKCAITAVKTCSDDANDYQYMSGFYAFENEYTTSFNIKVYNGNATTVKYDILAIYGAYV